MICRCPLGAALAALLVAASPAAAEVGVLRGPVEAAAADTGDVAAAKAGNGPAAMAPAKSDAAPPRPTYAVVARINLTTQQMVVSIDGVVRHSWAVSSGRSDFPTPRGSFRAQWMSRMWYSRKYDLAPMPHAVFFSGGAAIHGTQSTGLLGRPASHGCVRLAPGHAATFYNLVQKHGLARTQVVVFGVPPRAPAIARRDPPRPYPGQYARPRMPAPYYGAPAPAYRYVYQPAPAYQYSVWGTPIDQPGPYAYGYGPRPVAPRAIRFR